MGKTVKFGGFAFLFRGLAGNLQVWNNGMAILQ